ncbi:MAG: response regulator [Luteitalea sp.]|nr:response regulator [Luteitalea sp.]
MTLRVVTVDDEELSRRVLREYLAACPEVTLVAECANGFDAVKAVSEQAPDLIILDVQMPRLDGFEVLELIGSSAHVIFATAHDEYALKAFEVHAVDYLLKPFSQERLSEAVTRARARIATGAGQTPGTLVSDVRRRQSDRLLIRDGGNVHVLPVDALDFAQAQDDYVLLRANGRNYLKEQTLADLEASLDSQRFVRIHRSYLVNLDRITRVELYAKDSRVVILKDGARLPVSRGGYSRLSERL